MALRFIDFKTSKERPATSYIRPELMSKAAESNFEMLVRFAHYFFKSIEYSIRCWTFDVRCSMFIF